MIDNAIPVCFECHAEIHSYNDQHPRGRKFLPDELRGHKEAWLKLCRESPEMLLNARRDAGVGPLQALIDELEFNLVVTWYPTQRDWGCLFQDEQFRRAISEGAIATLEESLKRTILDAYVAMGRASQRVLAEIGQDARSRALGHASGLAQRAITDAIPKIQEAHRQLLEFLGHESGRPS
jgi:hypothetical protein